MVLLVKDGDADRGHETVAGELLLALGILLQNLGEGKLLDTSSCKSSTPAGFQGGF